MEQGTHKRSVLGPFSVESPAACEDLRSLAPLARAIPGTLPKFQHAQVRAHLCEGTSVAQTPRITYPFGKRVSTRLEFEAEAKARAESPWRTRPRLSPHLHHWPVLRPNDSREAGR